MTQANAFDFAFDFLHKLFASSRPDVFCKKGVLRNFTKFTGKQLCQSLFFNKVAGRTPFFIEHLWWLLLALDASSKVNL